jgi:hypothetical protein
MFDLLEKVLPIPEYTGLYLFICCLMFCRGCYDLSQVYWERERTRGPEYWQALLDSEHRNRN